MVVHTRSEGSSIDNKKRDLQSGAVRKLQGVLLDTVPRDKSSANLAKSLVMTDLEHVVRVQDMIRT